jgi:hypothetical protein
MVPNSKDPQLLILYGASFSYSILGPQKGRKQYLTGNQWIFIIIWTLYNTWRLNAEQQSS